MRYLTVIAIVISLGFFLPSCGKEAKSLKEELRVIKEENSFLKAENIALKKEVDELYKKLEEKEKVKIISEGPVKVEAQKKETRPAASDRPSDKPEKPDVEKVKKPENEKLRR